MDRFKTTVELEGELIGTYKTMVRRYGVKSAVSAGIALLARLEPKEREAIIDEVSGGSPSGQEVVATAVVAVNRRKARQGKQRQTSQKAG